MSTVLWALWVLAFAVLEYVGNRRPDDESYTLTNRIRLFMRSSPVARVMVRIAIGFGLAWLAWHFLVVDPAVSPGS